VLGQGRVRERGQCRGRRGQPCFPGAFRFDLRADCRRELILLGLGGTVGWISRATAGGTMTPMNTFCSRLSWPIC
jgi:hypothetical protein